MDAVSEDGSGLHVRQAARKRADSAKIADFTQLVTVAGRPNAIRVFTANEDAEARQYALDTGGIVVPLPLPPPRGYVVGPDGHLVPQPAIVDAIAADL